jgi:hypothetical protein
LFARFLGSRPQGLLLLFLALPLGFLSCNPTGGQDDQGAETLPLGATRLLGSDAPGRFCHAETLRLLGSCPQSLLPLPLRLVGSRPQGRRQRLVFLSLGLISCNATGALFPAETLSLGLLLPAQPLPLLGSSALGQL